MMMHAIQRIDEDWIGFLFCPVAEVYEHAIGHIETVAILITSYSIRRGFFCCIHFFVNLQLKVIQSVLIVLLWVTEIGNLGFKILVVIS